MTNGKRHWWVGGRSDGIDELVSVRTAGAQATADSFQKLTQQWDNGLSSASKAPRYQVS